MAGLALHKKILENTLSDGSDQSHLCVYHYSCPAMIPDRTAWLLDNELNEDPALGMAEVFASASRALKSRRAIAGIPCNTFHAPQIFDRFSGMIKSFQNIELLNMLDESLIFLKKSIPAESKIGVLSTTGTRKSGVYQALLKKADYEAVFVSEQDQELLHSAIYDKDWGIKATVQLSQKAIDTIYLMMDKLIHKGVFAIILACTELPLAITVNSYNGTSIIDPVLVLARALIREAAPEKLRPMI